MVAKGHDFPEVTLSAILDADATLRFPDFRAEERTFAMVAQLAGRCGRGEAGGEVIVQTLAPAARSSIAHAARHDSAGFLGGELERRRALALPALLAPRPDQPRLRARGALDEAAPRRWPRSCAARCPTAPSCSARRRCSGVRGRHRRRILIKASDRRARRSPRCATRSSAASATASLKDVAVGVDVDPQ